MTPDYLHEYLLRRSADTVKRDLELIHTPCGQRLCDAEDGDTLAVLAEVARDHAEARAILHWNEAENWPYIGGRRLTSLAADAAAAEDGTRFTRHPDGGWAAAPAPQPAWVVLTFPDAESLVAAAADITSALVGTGPPPVLLADLQVLVEATATGPAPGYNSDAPPRGPVIAGTTWHEGMTR